MCDVPSIAVFCSESIECFPGTASKFFLKLLITIPVAPTITGIITRILLLLLLFVVVEVVVLIVMCDCVLPTLALLLYDDHRIIPSYFLLCHSFFNLAVIISNVGFTN